MNFTALLQHFGDKLKNEIRVCIPAEVESFDSTNGTVNVKPLIKGIKIGKTRKVKLETGEVVVVDDESMPSIVNVPVSMIVFDNGRITFPIKPGLQGKLSICDRDIRNFKKDQVESAASSLRRFDLADAIFEPYLPKRSHLAGYNNEAIEVKYGTTLMKVDNDGIDITGNVKITGNLEVEGEAIISEEATIGGIDFTTHTHTYNPGPLPPSQTQPPTP